LFFALDLRFEGQESHITVSIDDPEELIDRDRVLTGFEEAYAKAYGYTPKDWVEVVNIRLTASGLNQNRLDFGELRMPKVSDDLSAETSRPVYFGEDIGSIETRVMDRDQLVQATEGPLILNSQDTTIVIPPNVVVGIDGCGNLVCDLSAILK
jgi:N-methylhydantoinase A